MWSKFRLDIAENIIEKLFQLLFQLRNWILMIGGGKRKEKGSVGKTYAWCVILLFD